MSEATKTTTNRDQKELVVERTFDAPRELVFKAWTEAERLKQWWGVNDWTVPFCEVDLRPGGRWHYCMQGPGGEQSWGLAVYQEIVPPERLVYIDAFSNEQGEVVEGMPQMTITVEFEDAGGKTRLISRTRFATADELDAIVGMGAIEGFTQTLDRLEAYLAQA